MEKINGKSILRTKATKKMNLLLAELWKNGQGVGWLDFKSDLDENGRVKSCRVREKMLKIMRDKRKSK